MSLSSLLTSSSQAKFCKSLLNIILITSTIRLIGVNSQQLLVFSRPVCIGPSLEDGPNSDNLCSLYDPFPEPVYFGRLDENALAQEGTSKESDPETHVMATSVDIPHSEKGLFSIRGIRLERFFKGADVADVMEEYAGTDLDMIEWPGLKTDDFAKGNIGTYFSKKEAQSGYSIYPLSYESHSAFDSYLCNRLLGTYIRAYGVRPLDTSGQRYVNYIPFYLSYGSQNFHHDYVQPLYAPVSELNLLSEGHFNDPHCTPIDPKNPIDRTKTKINHILVFAFSTNRVLLGMHCGILVVKNIDSSTISIEAAKRRPSPDAYEEKDFIRETYVKFEAKASIKKIKFHGPINLIASNVCCGGICKDDQPISVAYSYSWKRYEIHKKIIYVSFDNGDSWDLKYMSPYEATPIKIILGLYKRINEPPDPITVSQIVNLQSDNKWGESDEDFISRSVFGEGDFLDVDKDIDKEKEKQAEIDKNNNIIKSEVPSCVQIVSMVSLPEEEGFLALCRTDIGDPSAYLHPEDNGENELYNFHYAVFEVDAPKFNPTLRSRLRSKNTLACSLRALPKDSVLNEQTVVEPGLTLGYSSMNLFIRNCEGILYHSANGGRTFFNTVFYTKSLSGVYERQYQIPGLRRPMIAIDPNDVSVTLTFGDYYAYGQISSKAELRLVVSQVMETKGRVTESGICANSNNTFGQCIKCRNTALSEPECALPRAECTSEGGANDDSCKPWTDTIIRFNTNQRLIPYYTNSGAIRFSVSVMHFLLYNDNEYLALYEDRKGVRFINFPFLLTETAQAFFRENTEIREEMKAKSFPKCPTYAFRIDKTEARLDLHETVDINVSVEDLDFELSLGIFSSMPNLFKITTVRTNHSSGQPNEIRKHDWRVSITSLPVLKRTAATHEDSFYGSSYSPYVQHSANLVLTTQPNIRCHTQPIGSVYVQMGCKAERMVAHEDYDRKHCGRFFEKYTFSLLEGEYDEDMVSFWKHRSPFLFKNVGKDLIVEYDYSTFGCPIFPFRLDDFEPDLRIIDTNKNSNLSDTQNGRNYTGRYVLIEIFGQTGFTYSKTVQAAGCKRAPHSLKRLKDDWRVRKKMLYEANAASKDHKSFYPEEVARPENIWTKIREEDCDSPLFQTPISVDEARIPADEPYEIMQRGSENYIVWDRKKQKDLYFFIAVDIDQSGESFCDYTTFFAVTLQSDLRGSTILSVIRFWLFFFFLILLVLLGFFFYRHYSRRSYRQSSLMARLERGAWEILLRYEKYLHEVELHGNEKIRVIDRTPTLILNTPHVDAVLNKPPQKTKLRNNSKHGFKNAGTT